MMAAPNLKNLQGDLFSRGFPKYHESYYFFSIVSGKEKEFTQKLALLGKSGQISSLKKVLEDWTTIEVTPRDFIIDITNALIAFSKAGLDKIQLGLPDAKSLGLENLKKSDPAFNRGMGKDGIKNLNDPPQETWEAPFNKNQIHGVIKVAGKGRKLIDQKLEVIKTILGYPTIIADAAGESPEASKISKLDGKLRPKELGVKGHEHFGFKDGISQPLLEGIDSAAAFEKAKAMRTAQNIITVTKDPPTAQDGGSGIDAKKRPLWMVDGSFLVFRKLEQDVAEFIKLTEDHASTAHCANPDHFGAKLMGRWKSGAPITLFPDHDPTDQDPLATNNFKFTNRAICPLGAHIRKSNPRDDMPKTEKSRMIRNGIPYGEEFSPNTADHGGPRGLFFACYQSSIDNGFQFIQRHWSNNPQFPQWKTTTGHDPFIGQPKKDERLHITMFDKNDEDVDPPVGTQGTLPKLVTMRGGEYFFVPSISALSEVLGSA